tara:strand:+ start:1960 stop:2199 length:240 start_codon:yes stop_codon:yes gene_type:complete
MTKIPAISEIEGVIVASNPDDTLIDQVTYLLELADQNYEEMMDRISKHGVAADVEDTTPVFNLIDAVKLIEAAISKVDE